MLIDIFLHTCISAVIVTSQAEMSRRMDHSERAGMLRRAYINVQKLIDRITYIHTYLHSTLLFNITKKALIALYRVSDIPHWSMM